MSIKLMTKAWDSPAKGNDKLVLLAMCDFANDEGECFPSKSTISKKTGTGATSLTWIMGAYLDIGMWKIEKRTRSNGSTASNIYIIDTNMISSFNPNDFKEAYQKRRKYTKKDEKISQCDPHPKNHNVTPLNHNVTPQSTQCDPLEPSYLTINTLTISRTSDINFRKSLFLLKERTPLEFKLRVQDISLNKNNDLVEEIENKNLAYQAYLNILKYQTLEQIINTYLAHIEAELKNDNGRYVKGIIKFLLSYKQIQISLSESIKLKPIAVDYGTGGIRDYLTDKELLSFMEYQDILKKYAVIAKSELANELARREGKVA